MVLLISSIRILGSDCYDNGSCNSFLHDNSAKLVATIYGNVTDMGVDRAVQVFGNYNHQSKILRLESTMPKSWSYLTIDGDTAKYRMQTSRKPLKGNTLIVGDSNV